MSALKIIFWLSCVSCLTAQAQQNQSDPATTPERTVYTIAEKHPQFRGGPGALQQYLRNNLRYPKEALKEGIEHRVFVTFIVTDKGKIEDVHVLKPEVPNSMKRPSVWLMKCRDGFREKLKTKQ